MYDATDPHVTNPPHSNANPTKVAENQTDVYYTSVKRVRWTVPEIGQNNQVNPSAKSDTNHGKDNEIIDDNSTCARPQPPLLNKYEKVKGSAFSNIDVDEYGYNVTTQRTGDRRNLHTDNVYNQLSLK